MSKNISVKVGGVSRNFSNVPKIQTEEAITGDNIDWIPEDEANDYAVTETARITQNGTYHPSSGKCGFNEVVVNVSGGGGGGTLIEKTITANGDYYAVDDNADGYSKVSVNIVTPITYLTQAEYDALTLNEKIALGFIIIRNNENQLSGVWYDFTHVGNSLLPNSNPIDIIVYSEASSFNGVDPWGTGEYKVHYSDKVVFDSASASVNIKNWSTSAPKAEGVIDLQDAYGAIPDDFTVYGVCACDKSTTTFGYICSIYGEYTFHSCPVVACNMEYRIQCGAYADDRDTPYTDMQGVFFAFAMKFSKVTNNCVKIFVNDYVTDNITVDMAKTYRYIHLCVGSNNQMTDSRFKFIGVVKGIESDSVIEDNLEYLRDVYNI